jgi:hypothetical protein
LLLAFAAGAGFLLYRRRVRRDALRSMSVPSQWPIVARELVAPAESKVWHTRLSGVYCTFTVCGADRTVIGCVDVVGAGDGDRAHGYVKEPVLGKCGIPYM